MDKGAIRTVLLTGGAGFIGSHICVELVKSGYEVIIADNFVNSSHVVISRLRDLTSTDFKFYEVNVCDEVEFERVFVENHIDATIHLAGLKAVGESVSKPLEYYRNKSECDYHALQSHVEIRRETHHIQLVCHSIRGAIFSPFE